MELILIIILLLLLLGGGWGYQAGHVGIGNPVGIVLLVLLIIVLLGLVSPHLGYRWY